MKKSLNKNGFTNDHLIYFRWFFIAQNPLFYLLQYRNPYFYPFSKVINFNLSTYNKEQDKPTDWLFYVYKTKKVR